MRKIDWEIMFNILKKVFKSHNERKVNSYKKRVALINEHFAKLESLTEEQLKAKTEEFKQRYKDGETLDSLMPEAYAVVKDACRRLCGTTHDVTGHQLEWNMIPYDVQLLGGMVIHECGIAEMATGEGKTLVATLPLYLNALTGRNCQLVTVNDYLARRDSEWMGVLFKYLGLTVGCIQNFQRPAEKKEQYACDITYGTNSEFGFDYLRDMGASDKEDMVQRDHYFTIIDEIDSILIDEARTPLIISGPVAVSTHKYELLKPAIDALFRKQNTLCTELVNNAKDIVLDENADAEAKDKAILDLVKVKLGMPKHKQMMRLMEEPKIRKMLDKKEGEVRSSGNKGWLERVKETLYFSIDEQSNDVGLSEKGRSFINPDDTAAFVLPDLASQFSDIDNEEITDAEKLTKKQELQTKFDERAEVIHNISQLLKAYSLFEKDIHYVVIDNKVMIVDEHTGRIMDGRRFSDGLHQALEAKESVTIERETQTLASITIQNYFRMYDKLAGMTGTAETEATEFKDIYDLEVVTIPTNKPCIRKDAQDKIYKTKREKYNAIVNEIKKRSAHGQPVLVGTISVEVSEIISRLLKREKVVHNVLNAKQHQFEAEIVSRAGQRGSITIATNMAGRGTDIKLGEGVAELGGLHVIGSERHDSRRIDRQLRGRCSRQGDPGSTTFYVSLEDDLMRLFGSDRVASVMERLGMEDGEELCSPILSHSIGSAQKRVEQQHYSVRKRILQYDDVMNKQREIIYGLRTKAIVTDNTREILFDIIADAIYMSFSKHVPENPRAGAIDKDAYIEWLCQVFPITFHKDILGNKKDFDPEKTLEDIMKVIDSEYKTKEQFEDEDAIRWLEQELIISAIDRHYKEHLYEMDQLRNSIHLRQYAQKDPLVEYKQEAYTLFETLMDKIYGDVMHSMFKTSTNINAMRQFLMNMGAGEEIHVEAAPFEDAGDNFTMSTSSSTIEESGEFVSTQPQTPVQPLRRAGEKVGRNDVCPCGSGKKYKKCCGRF